MFWLILVYLKIKTFAVDPEIQNLERGKVFC
jgi:hypothetical protein